MALETGTFISDLNSSNPAAGDAVSAGDDHLRLLKSTIKATFPNVSGAVTPTHTELNFVDGVTSAIQTQLDAKAPLASPTFTGTPTLPTGTTIAAGATVTGYALLASPTFTGTPTLPTGTIAVTQAAGDRATKVATTAFVGTENIGSWTLIKSSPTGTGAAVDFINGSDGVVIDSTYDEYMFVLDAVTSNTDNDTLGIRTTTDATNFSAVLGDYNYAYTFVKSGGSAATDIGAAASILFIAQGVGNVAATENGVYGTVLMFEPSVAKAVMFQTSTVYQDAASLFTTLNGGGQRNTEADVDGVRFLWNTGNFASGTITLFGRRKT